MDADLLLRSRDSITVSRGLSSQSKVLVCPGSVLCFSKSGALLALVEPLGVRVLRTNTYTEDVLRLRRDKVIFMDFSPADDCLITCEKWVQAPNLAVWHLPDGALIHQFTVKKVGKESWPVLKWRGDGRMFLLKEGNEVVVYGVDGAEVMRVGEGLITSVFCSGGDPWRVLTFCGEIRGQPPIVTYYICQPSGFNRVAQETLAKGVEAVVLWNKQSTAWLIWCQTDVDTTGRSYYGEHSLYLMNETGHCKAIKTADGPIYDVSWSPTGEEFIVLSGFMPATCTLFNSKGNKVTEITKNHLNTIRWDPFGQLFILAGFGNLAGDMEIWARARMQVIGRLSSPMTVACEWCPDGLHIMTAVLTPRMRVDNGWKVWHYTGRMVQAEQEEGELWEAAWKPEVRRKPVIDTEIQAEESKKSTYRPPAGSAGFAERFRAVKEGQGTVQPSKPVPPPPAAADLIPGYVPETKKRRKKKKSKEGAAEPAAN